MRLLSSVLTYTCATFLALQPAGVLLGSTHCVEVVITESSLKGDETDVANNGKGNAFTGQITFTNYLSFRCRYPRRHLPVWQHEAWTPTKFSLDGRNLTTPLVPRKPSVAVSTFIIAVAAISVHVPTAVSDHRRVAGTQRHLCHPPLNYPQFGSAGIVYVDRVYLKTMRYSSSMIPKPPPKKPYRWPYHSARRNR